MIKAPAIGIDLGTTYSCVGVWHNGKVEIIVNDHGNRTTPSYVSFTDTERLIGEVAKNRAPIIPDSTIFNIKRLMGTNYSDLNLDSLKYWPFKVICDNERPKIETECKGELKQFVPEEISAMLITKMREIAEEYTKTPIKDAVITVPACFNNSQRQATLDAGIIAGLNVLKIINEPTAAVLAYVLDKYVEDERNIMLFDMGGGTLDVSIVTVYEGPLFEVRATAGNRHLGGEDFDNRLVTYLKDEVQHKYGKDLSDNVRAMCRIRNAAERAKCTLSSCSEAIIEIEALYLGINLYTKISRTFFEELCADLFSNILEPVEMALTYANMDRNAVDDVILVGGSTRMHKIQSLLQDYFIGKPLNLSVNPDEAIAYGAAVQAAILTSSISSNLQCLEIVDVTSQSLGIETAGGLMTNIIRCNTHIPCKQTLVFTTYFNNQSVITFQLFEGIQTFARRNHLLGTFNLTGIHPAFRGFPQIEVTFVLDTNGILKMTAKDTRAEGKSYDLLITSNMIYLQQKDMEKMVAIAKQLNIEDEKQKELIRIRNRLETYVFSFKKAIKEVAHKLSVDDKVAVEKVCENCIKWMDNNLLAEKDEYDDWYEQLLSMRTSVMTKLYPNINYAQASQNTAYSCGKQARDRNHKEPIQIRDNNS